MNMRKVFLASYMLFVTGVLEGRDLATADAAAQAGDFVGMQQAYEAILEQSPADEQALIGRATALAWQSNLAAAQQAFRHVLEIHPGNAEALVGLGYAYAWDGQYTDAHGQFRKALSIEPGNISARKGIGYSYYWEGLNRDALREFESALKVAPDDAELHEAVGRAKLAMGNNHAAVPHLREALRIQPDRQSAHIALRSAYVTTPTLEVTSWFGSTSGAGAGIRQIEIAHRPDQTTRYAFRYDNSLGLDNPSIADRGQNAPGYFGSIQKRYQQRFLLSAELGTRDLIDNRQTIFALQGTYLAGFGAIQLGLQRGSADNDVNDDLVFAGLNLPFADGWRVEPMLYLAETGATSDREWRTTVGIDYNHQGHWQAGLFGGVGSIDAADPQFRGDTRVLGLRGTYLFANRYSFHWGLRRDESPAADISIAEIGFTYRMISD